MNCEAIQELIAAEIAGELAEGDRASLHEHLAACPACREAREAYRRDDGALREAFLPRRGAAAELAERVIGDLGAPRALLPRRRRWIPLLAGAAAGFLLAAAIFRSSAPTVGPAPETRAGSPPPVVASPEPAPNLGKKPEKGPAKSGTVQLALATGPVVILRPGENVWEPLITGGAIEPGTRVSTRKDSRCEFRTPDGSEVRLNLETEIRFLSGRQLELVSGQLFSSVKHDEEPYLVRVPRDGATVRSLGTKFDVRTSEEGTYLTMVEGLTRVEDASGAELVQVKKGERAWIQKGTIREKEKAYELATATGWVLELLKLKGSEDDEYRQSLNSLLEMIGRTKLRHLPIEQIVDLGDHCVLPMVKVLEGKSAARSQEDRREAAEILEKVASKSGPRWAAGHLIPLLADGDPEVRYRIAKGLGALFPGLKLDPSLAPKEWRDGARDARESGLVAWRDWWEKNRELLPGGPDGGKSTPPEGGSPVVPPKKLKS